MYYILIWNGFREGEKKRKEHKVWCIKSSPCYVAFDSVIDVIPKFVYGIFVVVNWSSTSHVLKWVYIRDSNFDRVMDLHMMKHVILIDGSIDSVCDYHDSACDETCVSLKLCRSILLNFSFKHAYKSLSLQLIQHTTLSSPLLSYSSFHIRSSLPILFCFFLIIRVLAAHRWWELRLDELPNNTTSNLWGCSLTSSPSSIASGRAVINS